MELNDVLGIIGGVTGPLALALEWHQFRRDRPNLKLSTRFFRRQNLGQPEAESIVTVTLSNHGQRPLRVKALYFDLPHLKQPAKQGESRQLGGQMTPSGFKFEKMEIQEGDSEAVESGPLEASTIALCQHKGWLKIVAVDSLNRAHKAKVKVPQDLIVNEPDDT